MAFIEWGDLLITGVDRYDKQHLKLIGMINDLHDAIAKKTTEEKLGEVLKGLIEYTQTHFADEEEQMKACGYQGYTEHAAAHRALEARVAEYNQQQKTHALSLVDFMNFLHDWLINHIMQIDRQYGPLLSKKVVG
jgi:hemerythrin